jgi:hypothetical protein
MIFKNKAQTYLFNKSFTYIYPLLKLNVPIIIKGLINVYIGDISKPKLLNHIFILYKFNNTEEFVNYEAYLKESKSFVETYDPTPETVMFVFKGPRAYSTIKNLFISGKFSHFPDAYKKKILKYHNITDEDHKVVQVLNKDERLYVELEERLGCSVPRTMDPSSKPDLEIEIFSKSKYNL